VARGGASGPVNLTAESGRRRAEYDLSSPKATGSPEFDRHARGAVNTQQVLLGLGVATTLLALWAAFFATRADLATRAAKRLADQRWEDTLRPVPKLSFTHRPSPSQPIELEVENLGGTLAAGAVIVQADDDLYAGELTMADHAPPRRIQLAPVMKAWQKTQHPSCLLLVGRDVSGTWWDCLDGNKAIANPDKWLADQLRGLRLQGVVTFPGLSGPAKP
jgi:hypothetical protein